MEKHSTHYPRFLQLTLVSSKYLESANLATRYWRSICPFNTILLPTKYNNSSSYNSLCPISSWRSPASAQPPCWRSAPLPWALSCPNSPSQVCRSASFAFHPFSPTHHSAGSATRRSPTPTPSESDPAGGLTNQDPAIHWWLSRRWSKCS